MRFPDRDIIKLRQQGNTIAETASRVWAKCDKRDKTETVPHLFFHVYLVFETADYKSFSSHFLSFKLEN